MNHEETAEAQDSHRQCFVPAVGLIWIAYDLNSGIRNAWSEQDHDEHLEIRPIGKVWHISDQISQDASERLWILIKRIP